MSTSPMTVSTTQANEKVTLNKRLESIAWGLFLILLGCQAFIPQERVNEGYWSVGVGLILLGLNAARYMNQIRMSGFTTVLGGIALAMGICELAGVDLPGADSVVAPIDPADRLAIVHMAKKVYDHDEPFTEEELRRRFSGRRLLW